MNRSPSGGLVQIGVPVGAGTVAVGDEVAATTAAGDVGGGVVGPGSRGRPLTRSRPAKQSGLSRSAARRCRPAALASGSGVMGDLRSSSLPLLQLAQQLLGRRPPALTVTVIDEFPLVVGQGQSVEAMVEILYRLRMACRNPCGLGAAPMHGCDNDLDTRSLSAHPAA